MTFRNEDNLYTAFVKAVKKFEESLRGTAFGNLTRGKFRYLERKLDGRQVYLLGEEHYSRKPVDYVHWNLVRRIKESPGTWMVLIECAETPMDDPIDSPTHFYIQGLAKLFGLPYEEALADLYAPDTREYIRRNSGITEEDIDRLILTGSMQMCTPEQRADIPRLIKLQSKNLQKPPEYVVKLLEMGPKEDINFEEVVGRHWNDYSRERFHRLLERYSDRRDVMISVGYNHFPAFE